MKRDRKESGKKTVHLVLSTESLGRHEKRSDRKRGESYRCDSTDYGVYKGTRHVRVAQVPCEMDTLGDEPEERVGPVTGGPVIHVKKFELS